MLGEPRFLRRLFALWGAAHLVIGIVGVVAPRWFFAAAPPWPPLHVGQIQIAGVFDLAMATLFLLAAANVERHAGLAICTGVVAEVGHAAVRIGHVIAGDNPPGDLLLPTLMLGVAGVLVAAGVERRRRDDPFRWGRLVQRCLRRLRRSQDTAVRFVDWQVIPSFNGRPDRIGLWFICATVADKERFREHALERATAQMRALMVDAGFPTEAAATLQTAVTSAEEVRAGGGKFNFFR